MGAKEAKISNYQPKKRASGFDLSKDDKAYPKQPKDDEVKIQFQQMIRDLHLSEAQEEELKLLPYSVKWKLICKHKENLEKYDSYNNSGEEKAQEFIEKIKCNPSLLELKNLHQWLKGAPKQDMQTFLVYEGIYLLLNLLEVSELCSRSTRNYAKPLEILKIIELLCKDQDGFQHLIKVPKVLDVILFNLHPIHVDLSSTAMEILSDVIWNCQEGLGAVLDGLNHYKAERDYPYRFFPFLDILNNSDNAIMVENTLSFLNSIVSCPEVESERALLRAELIGCGILDSFDLITGKIDTEYKIDACTYESILESLQANKLAKKDKKSFESKIVISEVAVTDKDMEKYQESSRRQIKQGDNKVGIEALSKFRASVITETVDDEESNFERGGNYLELTNEKGFKKHIQGILNQIEVFDQMIEEDAESPAGLDELLSEIRNNALKLDSFEMLMGILQRMTLIPNSEKGKEVWEVLNEVMNLLIGTNDLAAFLDAKEVKSLLQRRQGIEELEEKLSMMESNLFSREVEIKKLTEERSFLRQETARLSEEVKNGKKFKRASTSVGDDTKTQLAIKIEHLIAREKEIEGLKREIGGLKIELANMSLEISRKKDELEKVKGELEGEVKKLKGQIEDLKKSVNTGVPSHGGPIPPVLPGISNTTGGPPLPPNLQGFGGAPKPPTIAGMGGPPLPPSLPGIGGAPKPPNLPGIGGPPLPPNLPGFGGAPKPPSLAGMGGPPLPPSLPGIGGAPKPPSLPGMGGPPLPPSLPGMGGPPGPPKLPGMGGPLPPSLPGMGGPPRLPGMGGPPPLPGMGGPPQLPGMGLPGMGGAKPPKQKRTPNVAMKGLLWTGLKQNQVAGTLWEKLEDEKVPLDISYLESNFATKTSSAPTGITKAATIIQKISVLDPNKSKSIDLILGKLKLSFTAITTALIEIDEKVLTVSNVESLINAVPGPEDVKAVKEFEGEPSQLANADNFVLEIANVPGYLERLQAMKFVTFYPEMIEEVEIKVDKFINIWKFFKEFKEFHIILEYILACGNYLNGTSTRGGMYGFKLDSLEKAAELKPSAGKKTLLHYIIEKLYTEGKISLEDREVFEDLDIAARIPISQLNTDLAEIKKGEKYITMAIAKNSSDPNDNIAFKMNPHLPIVQESVKNLDEKLKTADSEYQDFIKFIGENPKETSEKIAEKLQKFFLNCQKYRNEIEKSKIEDEKKKLKESMTKPKPTSNSPVKSNALLEPGAKVRESTSSIINELKERKKQKAMAAGEGYTEEKGLTRLNSTISSSTKDESNIDIQRLDNILVQGILNKRFYLPLRFRKLDTMMNEQDSEE